MGGELKNYLHARTEAIRQRKLEEERKAAQDAEDKYNHLMYDAQERVERFAMSALTAATDTEILNKRVEMQYTTHVHSSVEDRVHIESSNLLLKFLHDQGLDTVLTSTRNPTRGGDYIYVTNILVSWS